MAMPLASDTSFRQAQIKAINTDAKLEFSEQIEQAAIRPRNNLKNEKFTHTKISIQKIFWNVLMLQSHLIGHGIIVSSNLPMVLTLSCQLTLGKF